MSAKQAPVFDANTPPHGGFVMLISRIRWHRTDGVRTNQLTMQKYMLIVREDLSAMRGLTPEQRFGGSPDMNSWVNELINTGKYIMGQPFAIEGYYVSKTGAEQDGDFLKNKEGLSGFDLIYAEDLAEALEIAKRCPMVKIGMAIREVRPFQEFPG